MYIDIWKKMLSPTNFILETISGYLIPFTSQPPILPPSESSFTFLTDTAQAELVNEEVISMLAKGAIEEIPPSPGCYSRLFVVPKKDGGFRPVINLKRINKEFLEPPHFRMDGLKEVAILLRPGDWAASVDLKDAYFHIPLNRRSRRFLRFGWKKKLYQFLVLPFGLSTAPFVFTMVTKPIVAFLRSRGIRVLFYLDDILVIGKTKEECEKNLKVVLDLLQSLGFLINWKKSNLVPSQRFLFLGLLWDSTLGQICLPQNKLLNLQRLARSMAKIPPTCHGLQVLLGHMTASIPAVPLIRLYARPLQRDLAAVYSFPHQSKLRVSLSQNAKDSLNWILCLDLRHCQAPMWPLVAENCDLEVSTDASDLGWGIHFDGQLLQGAWTADAPLHINAKELITLHIFLRDYLPSSDHPRALLWRSDSMTAISYIRREGGTVSPVLLQIATDILLLADQMQLRILPAYVPTDENLLADAASRFQSLPDWHLLPSIFSLICRRWGTPEIDLFATESSTQLTRFFAWGQARTAEAFDALLQPWNFRMAYAFPPPPLLPRVLNKIAVSTGEFILITPLWKTQKWFPLLLEMDILEVRRLPLLPDLVVDLTTASPPHKLGPLHLLAWRILGGSTHLPSRTSPSTSLPGAGANLHPTDMTQHGDPSKIFCLPEEFLSIKSI